MDEASAGQPLILRIQAEIASVPQGQTCSYGVIATRAGAPGRARLVGKVLREAPAELGLPWHRIIRADGRPAFPPESEAWREQCRRLLNEGVELRQGKVPEHQRARTGDIDALLWRPSC